MITATGTAATDTTVAFDTPSQTVATESTVPIRTPSGSCRECGNLIRVTYVVAGDIVVPGLWQCTHCPAGRHSWPRTDEYRCK